MPTTTATLTLSSSDLLTDNLSLSSTMTLYQDGTTIGRLYSGDWMFMPWDCDLSAAANDSSIECQAYTGENIIEYALFHNGETLVTASDS